MKTKVRFTGRHYETGSIHNALKAQGVKAPHTGEPYSEALLLGVSGGIAFGYFTFEYKGHLPHVALLTRNTFGPFTTMLERLGIAQDIQQTNKPEIAEKNLKTVLASGLNPLVLADQFSMPYSDLNPKQMWNMAPVLATATDGSTVTVVDRSSQPFHVAMADLTKARGRVKEDRFKLMTLDAPQTQKLPAAVHQGIWQTIQLFTEKPPKGGRDNFGFAAYEKFADLLVNTRNKHGWARYFEPGVRMFHALVGAPGQPGAYFWVNHWGAADGAERGLYADFLDEAAVILKRPTLRESAAVFRESHKLWLKFADALLPQDVPMLAESRKLIDRKQKLFFEQGEAALDEIRAVNVQLRALLKEAETDFSLTTTAAMDLRANWSELIRQISATEQQAVQGLQAAIM